MSESIPTFGGRASRSETYSKLIHHIREAQSLAAVMGHLHNTEDGSEADKLHVKGWLGMSQVFDLIAYQVTMLAQGKLLQ